MGEISAIFDALSQGNRLKIFRLLVEHSENGITPTAIAAVLDDMPRNTLSFHLHILSQARLCSFEKSGKQIIYKPICATVRKAAAFLLKDCCSGGCEC